MRLIQTELIYVYVYLFMDILFNAWCFYLLKCNKNKTDLFDVTIKAV